MDPRHPEQAISRMRELMKQYDRIEADMKKATTSAQLAQLEREGGLVVQEICLVAPRIHEAMMQTSRQRRHDLSRGILTEPQDTAVETPQGGMFEPEIAEDLVGKSIRRTDIVINIENPYGEMTEVLDHSVAKEQEQIFEEMTKPKKKAIRKKKTTKKAGK